MRDMFYCPNCKSTWSQENSDPSCTYECPECYDTLIPMGISQREWQSKSFAEKSEIKERIANQVASGEQICAYSADEMAKMAALSSMLITSGFNFDGYKITRYSGYISGDDAVQIPRTGYFNTSNNGKNLTDSLVKIRRQALKELKEAAYALGCNAVIGVDFDYMTLDPQTANILGGTTYEPYVICVTANGNAVVIEKE